MKARDVMSPDIETLSSGQTIKEAAVQMLQHGIGYFPVCDRGLLVGVVTDRDIACRVVAEGLPPDNTRVGDVMSTDVVYCRETEEIAAVIKLMERHAVRRVPIIDRDERLVGIISVTDLAQHLPKRITAELLLAVSREAPLSVTIHRTKGLSA